MQEKHHQELAKIMQIWYRAKETRDIRKGKRYINALMKWTRRIHKGGPDQKFCSRKAWNFSFKKIAKEIQ